MPIDWIHLHQTLPGCWVALADDEVTVLGSGATAADALRDAHAKGYSEPILARLLECLLRV
jgi:hypothetical protein